MTILGVLFDFDGIIADTERLHYLAFQEVLVPLEMGFSWEDYVTTYMGFDDRGVYHYVFDLHGKDLTSDALAHMILEKAQWFEAQAEAGRIPLFPGVEALIREAAAHGPVGICSGALVSDIQPILKQFRLEDCFQFMVTAEDVEESKPHPASYELAAAKLQQLAGGVAQLPLESILAIEDTPAGIQSALGAGLRTAGIGHTYTPDVLRDAHVVFPSFEGLTLDLIDQELSK